MYSLAAVVEALTGVKLRIRRKKNPDNDRVL
jgi:hypothetical protein